MVFNKPIHDKMNSLERTLALMAPYSMNAPLTTIVNISCGSLDIQI